MILEKIIIVNGGLRCVSSSLHLLSRCIGEIYREGRKRKDALKQDIIRLISCYFFLITMQHVVAKKHFFMLHKTRSQDHA
ncbi:Uncharacterized protein dnm_063900 [Desulfonema magnum]|uniref:Uncharacterized protein n=1 Tax=Desulfonema magnum TaxID=45655 RepID=A0A975GQW8_9BACT|nr:Uncharacterized protein dnm_063900 [Desulfonema magnum]